MKGLSNKEIEIISLLEFDKKYFFTAKDIQHFTKNKMQMYNIIKHLVKKQRIIKINKTKYYLIPIKAKSGKWVEYPYIVIDEICDGKDYYIGGWAAANHWKLTDQIPMRYDVYTTRRQGKMTVLNTRIVFHRARPKRIQRAVVEKVENHNYRMQSYEDSKQWMKSRK